MPQAALERYGDYQLVRYLTAGGDPTEVDKAKSAFKSAGIGYALAFLAPVLLTMLQSILA